MQMTHCRATARRPRRAKRGFTLNELTTAMAFAGVGLALLSVAMPRFRSGAMLEDCIDNQREMSAGSATYALANQDEFVGLNWKRNNATSAWQDLVDLAAGSSVGAHAAQVIDLWRRHGRLDIPAIHAFLPDHQFQSSPLIDFLGKDLTDPFNVCPSDEYRLAWRADPAGFDAGLYLPLQPPGGSAHPSQSRWAYSSSYLFTVSAFDPSQSDPNGTHLRISQHGTFENLLTVPGSNPLGPSLASAVRHPSAKVFFFDHADRHFAPEATHFAVPGAVVPATFFDGSVRVVESDRANVPWRPIAPSVQEPTSYTYQPKVWEPQGGVPASGSVVLDDPFRYTRDGLRGIDFPPLSRVRGATTSRTR